MITVNPCNVLRALWNDYSSDFHLTNTISERESNLVKLLKSIIDSSIDSSKHSPSVRHVASLSHSKLKYTSSLSSSSSHADLTCDSEGQVSPVSGNNTLVDNNCNYRNIDRSELTHVISSSSPTQCNSKIRKTRISPVQHTTSHCEGRNNYLRSYSSPFHTPGATDNIERNTNTFTNSTRSVKTRFNNFNRSLSTDTNYLSFNVLSIPSPILPVNVSTSPSSKTFRSMSMASLTINEDELFQSNERHKNLSHHQSVCVNDKTNTTHLHFHHVTHNKSTVVDEQVKSCDAQLFAKKKKHKQRLLHFLLRRPSIETLEAKGIIKNELVFGCDLKTLCIKEQSNIPKFVKIIIASIEVKNLKTDGIYRVSGNLSHVQKLRFQINQDNYTGIWKEDDIHILTSLFKMFLREMKEPLISYTLFDTLIASMNIDNYQRKIDTVVRLIDSLDLVNYHTLKYILQHLLRFVYMCTLVSVTSSKSDLLYIITLTCLACILVFFVSFYFIISRNRVEHHRDDNRMHIPNLSIVFGPTLMWSHPSLISPAKASDCGDKKYSKNCSSNITSSDNKLVSSSLVDTMLQQMKSNKVIEFLLTEYNIIFNQS